MCCHASAVWQGLDSIKGKDAPQIEMLFKAMAVYDEDQTVPLVSVNALWRSLDTEHSWLGAVKLRSWWVIAVITPRITMS